MTNIYLIDEETIRTQTLLGENVDSAFIRMAIQYAQSIDLQEVIGTRLLKSILTQVEVEAWKSAEYQTLTEQYIQPYLVMQVMSEIILPLQVKHRNAGNVLNNDTHYQSLSMNDVEKVREDYRHKAAFLAARVTDYIKANYEVFASEIEDMSQFVPMGKNETRCPIFFPQNDLTCNDLL